MQIRRTPKHVIGNHVRHLIPDDDGDIHRDHISDDDRDIISDNHSYLDANHDTAKG